jgi:prepilin-type N-terminal cleavage/methylation domain-containing protein
VTRQFFSSPLVGEAGRGAAGVRVAHRKTTAGFTLIELLIAMLVSGIVLGVVVNAFASHLKASREQQAREELRSNVQAALELVTEDIRNSGSWGVPTTGLKIEPADAIKLTDVGTPYDRLKIRYRRYTYPTSTTPAGYQYVDVAYRLLPDEDGESALFRSQVAAGATTGCDQATAGTACQPAAAGIVALNVRFEVRTRCTASSGLAQIYITRMVDSHAGYFTDAACASTVTYDQDDISRAEVTVVGRVGLQNQPSSAAITVNGSTITQESGFIYQKITGVADTPSL